ncbi:hypothetical protein E2C01_081753 [Portunus trituberculatus]|uniref:Uncharacterized protein n=1 Tax=Portunus trituberculatus TaxID=210409 RepID=A0A5B7J363_PORTR|nr:hypothetical protein [Portunus trituberculatus]
MGHITPMAGASLHQHLEVLLVNLDFVILKDWLAETTLKLTSSSDGSSTGSVRIPAAHGAQRYCRWCSALAGCCIVSVAHRVNVTPISKAARLRNTTSLSTLLCSIFVWAIGCRVWRSHTACRGPRVVQERTAAGHARSTESSVAVLACPRFL